MCFSLKLIYLFGIEKQKKKIVNKKVQAYASFLRRKDNSFKNYSYHNRYTLRKGNEIESF